MDFSLRCNSLDCRSQLTDQAVVTTCSHIFCVPCSESLGLARPNGTVRVCPACETQLSNPDDVVVTQLNPTEDYKTSVLSGLSPTIIIECAARGLSFYSYQNAQEIIYHEFLARSLTDKYSSLSSQMDQVIHDANHEITKLREKIKTMGSEQKALEQKCDKLAESCREKERAKQQYQKMYTNLRRETHAAGLEIAADHNAENVLETARRHSNNYCNGQQNSGRVQSNGSVGSDGHTLRANLWQERVQGSRAGIQSARRGPAAATPSGHRTRLPAPIHGNGATNQTLPGENVHQGTPYRSVLHNIDPNIYGNSNGAAHGSLSAGVKIGRQQQGPNNGSGLGASRPSGLAGLNVR